MILKKSGIVFNIQRYSIHDGPGIRTIVFLKGCPLRCKWCSNPESQELNPELRYMKQSCVHCHFCIHLCPRKAITPSENGIEIDRSECNKCFKCVENCVTGALKIEGKKMSVDEVVDEVMKDEVFYRRSGGGVTLSGGEVLVQYSFAAAILKAVKEKGINTAIETTGYASWNHFQQVLEYTDYVLYDLKHTDNNKHSEGTGVGLSKIIENLYKIAESGKNLIVRIPLIPGFNMDEKNIIKTIELLKTINQNKVHILPFHQLGSQKYEDLGREYQLKHLKPPNDNEVSLIKEIFKRHGIKAIIGG